MTGVPHGRPAGRDEPAWSVTGEADLTPETHAELAGLLRTVYPERADAFPARRSWRSGRPEWRLVGRVGGEAVAHLGVVHRRLRLDEPAGAVVVGEVGLVGVRPAYRGTGLGRALLARGRDLLATLEVPFGLLTCREDVVGFYGAAGWQRVPGVTLRMLGEHGGTVAHDGAVLVLPVAAPDTAWPAARVITRDASEV